MSLTEREKEISEEVAALHDNCTDAMNLTVYRNDVVSMFDLFLSRIREEQEAIATIIVQNDFVSLSASVGMLNKLRSMHGMPLFTIPPAAPECKDLEMIKRMMETGTADSFMSLTDEQKRMAFAVGIHESTLRKQISNECSELVEALERLARLGNEPNYGNSIGNDIAKQALTNHAKRMEG